MSLFGFALDSFHTNTQRSKWYYTYKQTRKYRQHKDLKYKLQDVWRASLQIYDWTREIFKPEIYRKSYVTMCDVMWVRGWNHIFSRKRSAYPIRFVCVIFESKRVCVSVCGVGTILKKIRSRSGTQCNAIPTFSQNVCC